MARSIGPVSGTTKTYIPENGVTAGYAVAVGTAQGACRPVNAVGQRCIGISDQTVVAGNPARITRSGDAVAFAGGAVTHGQYVKADATGRMIAVTGTPGSGEEVVGRAESDSTAAGDELVVFVSPFVL